MNWRFTAFGALVLAIAALSWTFSSVEHAETSRRQLWGLGQAYYHQFREKLSARRLPDFTAERFLHGAQHSLGRVEASAPSGLVRAPLSVSLSGDGPIYYTMDGSLPTRRSARYRTPIVIEFSTVVRARVLASSALPGPVSTFHYIVESDASLPVLSIASDPVNLWNKYSGIYANPTNRGRSWEREADFGYFQPRGAATEDVRSVAAEIRIHGGYSRLSDKKSFRLRYSLINSAPLSSSHPLHSSLEGERTIVVRSDQRSAVSRVRDAVGSALASELGLLTSRRSPVELYLNGAYWGAYDIRERVDLNLLLERFGEGSYDLFSHDSQNAKDWLSPVSGNSAAWNESMRMLRELDLTSESGLSQAESTLDLASTMDYWAHNIIVGNVDWPHNNISAYRRTDGNDKRWRWISWDLDAAFSDSEHNTLAWALRDRLRNDLRWNYARGARDSEQLLASTELFRTLLQNPTFRERFVARIQVLAELHYTEQRIAAHLEQMSTPLEEAYERDSRRWEWNVESLQISREQIVRFARERPAHLRAQLASELQLKGGEVEIQVLTNPGDVVTIEGLGLPAGSTTLRLLEGTSISVTLPRGEAFTLTVDEPLVLDTRPEAGPLVEPRWQR